ncbi:MAG TPA: hypothetical protein VK741_21790 [Acetobacteraceae bacterium]|nr:hypothetical protein [Acetobacteraceae bacterium]
MNELSGYGRARRRGATSQGEFLEGLRALGFAAVAGGPGVLYELRHRDTGDRAYSVPFGDSYTRALARLTRELESARQYGAGV